MKDVAAVLNGVSLPGVTFRITGADIEQRRTTEPPDRSRVFAWKREMSRDEQLRFDAIAGDVLGELGFARA